MCYGKINVSQEQVLWGEVFSVGKFGVGGPSWSEVKLVPQWMNIKTGKPVLKLFWLLGLAAKRHLCSCAVPRVMISGLHSTSRKLVK